MQRGTGFLELEVLASSPLTRCLIFCPIFSARLFTSDFVITSLSEVLAIFSASLEEAGSALYEALAFLVMLMALSCPPAAGTVHLVYYLHCEE